MPADSPGDSGSESGRQAAPASKSLGPLAMIWRAAAAYPGRVLTACCALMVTATATLAVPWGFSHIIDHGFSRGSTTDEIDHWIFILFGIVAVLSAGTAV
ncbi:MAG TPA: ABC transporter, partial [Novosphingobium sp.]|nr:ABC transporter [Novosphingobium sp.]